MMVADRRQPARFQLRGRGPGRGSPTVEYRAVVLGLGIQFDGGPAGDRASLRWQDVIGLGLLYGGACSDAGLVAAKRAPARFTIRGHSSALVGVEIEYRVEVGDRGLEIHRPLDGRRLALSWRRLVSLALAYGCGVERRPV